MNKLIFYTILAIIDAMLLFTGKITKAESFIITLLLLLIVELILVKNDLYDLWDIDYKLNYKHMDENPKGETK